MAYSVLWTPTFFLRNMAVIGSLLLLFAETTDSARVMFAGVPTVESVGTGDYLQVAGRVLIVFMFLALFKFDSAIHIFVELIGLGALYVYFIILIIFN